MTVEFIRELRDNCGQTCLVRRDGEYFVLHPITPPADAPPSERREILAFASTPEGGITDWREVASGTSREEVIARLEH